jgi:hypothetical protein
VRTRVLNIVVVILSLVPVGCAGGFRVGGNNFGAGVGGYIGPVPDAIKSGDSCYPPPPPPNAVSLPPG